MKEKEKTGIIDYLNDPKYRARIILGFYLLLFIAIIIWFRSIPKENLNTNNNKTDITNEEKDTQTGPLALISGNNFKFQYILSIDNNITTSIGKKYMAKEEFEATNNESTVVIEYYADGLGVNGREKTENEVKNTYVTMNKPYLFIDYFNTSTIEKIINNSTKTENNTKLTITNEELCNIIGCPTKVSDGVNTIDLEMKNNYIVGIRMDYSSFATALNVYYMTSTFTTTTFELKYSDFNLIDNFDIKN